MKGGINNAGELYIERPNYPVICSCIHKNDIVGSKHTGRVCTHFCPAFREPVVKRTKTVLRLCAEIGKLEFEEFLDARVEKPFSVPAGSTRNLRPKKERP